MRIHMSLCFWLLFVLCLSSALPLLADEGDPPGRIARLSYLQGSVSFEPSGEENWAQATLNYPLTTGDRLWTDTGARAELETGNVAIRMWQQTDLTTTNLNDQLIQLGLAQGSLRISAYNLPPGQSVEVDTPNAAITVVQPGNYRVDTYPNQNMTLVTVNTGSLQITGNGINQTVESGQSAQLTGSNPVQLNWTALPPRDDFDEWSNKRDEKYLRAKSRQYVSPSVPGYYDLDGYGNWATVADYGPIWYPAGVAVAWCPYRYGRWVWVEPWGWTWVEDEPWGFAPFHYGRWVQIGVRWGWLPGPIVAAPVYAPAFVAFIGGPGFTLSFGFGGVAAWFPLGPGEPFFPWYHHSNVYLQQINITNVRNINITNINVTNINNIHYRYRTVATTAVPANALRNSEPVARNMVHLDPSQIERAQVIPHPSINPTPRAIAGGTRPTRPPVPPKRPAMLQHPPVAARALPNGSARPVPNELRTPPMAANHPAPAPTAAPHSPPPAAVSHSRPPAVRPPLVTRTAPPPERLPYAQRAPAMAEHPGRPLEPQQSANIYAGRLAGPMIDREFPPHATPRPLPAVPAVHAAPPPHPH